MNNVRFDDASKLRAKMLGKNSQSIAQDDSGLLRKSTDGSADELLTRIINDRDEWDDNISLGGIEPFVFLELRDEMVKKKAIAKTEIIDFVKAGDPDPQGWRLAKHSRVHTQWARNIAQEKARALHEVLLDESKHLPKKTELEKLKESQDVLNGSIRAMRNRGSAPKPPPRRSGAGRRPQRRASICGPSSAAAPDLSQLFSMVEVGATTPAEKAPTPAEKARSQLFSMVEVGAPTPAEKAAEQAQLQQLTRMFSLSDSDDDEERDEKQEYEQ